MVKEKLLRPKRARSQGEILPHMDTLIPTHTQFEDYHTKRSDGANTKFKDTTVKTVNLNGHWIDVVLSLFSVDSRWVYGHEGVMKAKLTKKDGTAIVDEKVYFTVNNSPFIRRTDSNGVVTLHYTPDYLGSANYTIEYKGNNIKGYKETPELTGTINVEKIGVVITQSDLEDYTGTTFTIKPTVKTEFGDLISGETLKFMWGQTEHGDGVLSNGTCTFTRKITATGQHNYWLSFPETEIYKHATKNFIITVNAYESVIKPAHLSYDVIAGNDLSLRVAVVDQRDGTSPVDGGSVQLLRGNEYLGVQTLDSTGKAEFTYNSTSIGTQTLTFEYIPSASSIYGGSTRNITVQVTAKYPSHVAAGHLTYSVEKGAHLEIRAKVLNDNNQPVNGGTVSLKSGSTVLDTATVDTSTGLVTFDYVNHNVGSVPLTLAYSGNNIYQSSSQNITVEVTQASTTTSITLADMTDWVTDSGGFNVKVKNANTGNLVTEGTVKVELIKEDDTNPVTKTIGTYDVADTTANISVNRQNVSLDTLYNAMKQAGHLYYTGYRVKATYTGTNKYLSSNETRQPMTLKVRKSSIVALIIKQNTPDYNIKEAYPSIPTNLENGFKIVVDHDETEGIVSKCIVNNIINNAGINSYADMGPIQKGQTLYFATVYRAHIIKDTNKNATESSISSEQYTQIGGLSTELHYRINNGTEQDSANAYLNGSGSKYDTPIYTKFSVPNTCQAGDVIKLIFYTGKNSGYYHYLEGSGSDQYGYRYGMMFTVVE